jgi:hypothetical protein
MRHPSATPLPDGGVLTAGGFGGPNTNNFPSKSLSPGKVHGERLIPVTPLAPVLPCWRPARSGSRGLTVSASLNGAGYAIHTRVRGQNHDLSKA